MLTDSEKQNFVKYKKTDKGQGRNSLTRIKSTLHIAENSSVNKSTLYLSQHD